MLQKIKKKILITIAAAAVIYLGFTIYADFNQVAQSFSEFNWALLPLLLLLSLANYFVRFWKWDYYLSILNVPLKKIDSLYIFFSGLIMSVTPGKFGEVLKSYMIKEINNTPISKTAPIIFVERITDSVSLMLIAVLGAYVYGYGEIYMIIIGLGFIILLAVISSRKISLWMIGHLEKISFLKNRVESIHTIYESSYSMLRPFPLFYMTAVSLIAWFFECLGYHLILINFGIDAGLFWASFSYAFATLIGAVTMLPGGLGATEGSLTFMLIQKGAAKDVAVASTFIVRVVTLWFAILVGIISVLFYQKRFGKLSLQEIK